MLDGGKPQLPVLDEPTNHRDGSTRDALAEAMAEFDGALLLVSHDRYMLRASVDQFVRVAQGRMDAFEGDLDDYAQWLLQPGSSGSNPALSEGSGRADHSDGGPGLTDDGLNGVDATLSRKAERRAAAQARARLAVQRKPLEQRLQAIEQCLA